jgi:hypothetical protein
MSGGRSQYLGNLLTAMGFASVRTKSEVTLRVSDMLGGCVVAAKELARSRCAIELWYAAHCTSGMFRHV